jgi:hypothetical protein
MANPNEIYIQENKIDARAWEVYHKDESFKKHIELVNHRRMMERLLDLTREPVYIHSKSAWWGDKDQRELMNKFKKVESEDQRRFIQTKFMEDYWAFSNEFFMPIYYVTVVKWIKVDFVEHQVIHSNNPAETLTAMKRWITDLEWIRL